MKTLTESIVDVTTLPVTYSGTDALLLEEDGNENMTTQLADSFAQAINRTAGPLCDTNFRGDKRVSLNYVSMAEDL